jgi:hypothetical protein
MQEPWKKKMKDWKLQRGWFDRFLWDHKNDENQGGNEISIYAQRIVMSSYI